MVRHDSDRAKLDQGHVFDASKGQKVIDHIQKYCVLESGKPFKVLPWCQDVIHSWYSWIAPTGYRSTKLGLLTCGRKNAKSALTYGLISYHLIADGEMSPSCVSCAVDKEQASQIYNWFAFAREQNPILKKHLHPNASYKTMTYPHRNGRYRSIASGAANALGHGHSFVIHDEMAFARNDDLFTALKNSTDARPNGFQVITSTAGWNKNGAFYKLVQYSRDILSGKIIDPTFQPWIFEVPEGADLDDRRNWYLANPSLGITQSEADFAGQWERERRDGSTKLAFQRLKFNMWTDAENAWVSPEAFDACRGDTTIPGGTPVVLAADIGATRDLTAISLVARVGERIVVKTWGFVPSGYTNTRDNANTVKYQQFANEGGLEITPGTATDLDYIMKKLDGLCSRYKVQAVVFDRWQSLPLANHLSRKGVPTFNFPQTHSYFNAPCLEFERLVNSRKVVHDGSGLLRWQIGHTYLTRDSKGYVKPESASPPLKKDNLIATLMGLSQCLQAGEAKPSVYESQGVFVL